MSIRTLSQQKVSSDRYNKLNKVLAGSTYFDGDADWLSVADNAALRMGTGSFTIEFWFNLTSGGASYQGLFDKGYTSGLLIQTAGAGYLKTYHANSSFTASSTFAYDVWNHFALVRNSNTLVMYLNGTSVGSASTSMNHTSTDSLLIGTDTNGGSNVYVKGYLSNYRVVKGTAVYTSNFSVPTSALTAISGTSLLTCQNRSGTITDASSNAFTVSVTGNTTASGVAPF